MEDRITPSRKSLSEALALSEEILRNIELNEIPLTNIALKASRLARLLNDFGTQKTMEYEAAGYPRNLEGLPPDVWNLAVQAGRNFLWENPATKETKEYVYIESISELEEELRVSQTALIAAKDSDASVSSANPIQYVFGPTSNAVERSGIRQQSINAAKRLANSRTIIYRYVMGRYQELAYSGIAGDIFTRIRSRVDTSIGKSVPEAVQRLSAVYKNLQSDNPEDWSNAVHSCRRILEDLADAIYPPCEDKVKIVNGKETTIKMGKGNTYTNRIIAFVEDHATSEKFSQIVGSNIMFLGDRLDSAFEASHKGTHTTIVSKEEADRYVVYTYLLVGDILSLLEANS